MATHTHTPEAEGGFPFPVRGVPAGWRHLSLWHPQLSPGPQLLHPWFLPSSLSLPDLPGCLHLPLYTLHTPQQGPFRLALAQRTVFSEGIVATPAHHAVAVCPFLTAHSIPTPCFVRTSHVFLFIYLLLHSTCKPCIYSGHCILRPRQVASKMLS